MTTPHNRTSTAYDMSLFDTSKRKEQQTPEKKPELKVATSSVAKSGRPVAVAVIGAVFLAVFVMFLYSRSRGRESAPYSCSCKRSTARDREAIP